MSNVIAPVRQWSRDRILKVRSRVHRTLDVQQEQVNSDIEALKVSWFFASLASGGLAAQSALYPPHTFRRVCLHLSSIHLHMAYAARLRCWPMQANCRLRYCAARVMQPGALVRHSVCLAWAAFRKHGYRFFTVPEL